METKYIVNNVTGQTINGNLTINGDVVITGTTNTRPYKVYTSLLTQSGEDGPSSISGGDLIIGITYLINSNSGADFTNVGAPNNDIGTYFVATGTTPNSWGSGTLDYNTGAPVVTVLENTIGNIWFTFTSDGDYRINSDGLFNANKCWVTISPGDFINNLLYQEIFYNDINTISIYCASDGVLTNSVLNNAPIEIRVYN